MSEIIRRPADARTLRSTDPLTPLLPVKIRRAIDREAAYGIVNAARAQAAGFAAEARVDAVEMVAERAMLGLDRLHRVEAALAKQDPIRAERYSGLVEDFLMIARTELRRLPREF
jgi:hypothetical protein